MMGNFTRKFLREKSLVCINVMKIDLQILFNISLEHHLLWGSIRISTTR